MQDSISGFHIIILSSQSRLIYDLYIVNVHARSSTFTLVSLSVWQANLHGADKCKRSNLRSGGRNDVTEANREL